MRTLRKIIYLHNTLHTKDTQTYMYPHRGESMFVRSVWEVIYTVFASACSRTNALKQEATLFHVILLSRRWVFLKWRNSTHVKTVGKQCLLLLIFKYISVSIQERNHTHVNNVGNHLHSLHTWRNTSVSIQEKDCILVNIVRNHLHTRQP